MEKFDLEKELNKFIESFKKEKLVWELDISKVFKRATLFSEDFVLCESSCPPEFSDEQFFNFILRQLAHDGLRGYLEDHKEWLKTID